MVRAVLSAIAFVSVVAQLAAQGPFPPPKTPPAKSAVRDSQHVVVVEGCLRGSRLKIDRRARSNVVTDALGASEFVLEGAKELLQQIRREHDGHQDEITGLAIVPASRTENSGTATKQIGTKTRVTVGTRAGRDDRERAGGFGPVRLKVDSLRHIHDKCAIPE